MAITFRRTKEAGFKAHLEKTCRMLLAEAVLGSTDFATAQITIRRGNVFCNVEVWHRGRKPRGNKRVTLAEWRLVEKALGASKVLCEFRPSRHRKNPVFNVGNVSPNPYTKLFARWNRKLAAAGLVFRFRCKHSRNKTEPVVYSLVASAKRSRS